MVNVITPSAASITNVNSVVPLPRDLLGTQLSAAPFFPQRQQQVKIGVVVIYEAGAGCALNVDDQLGATCSGKNITTLSRIT